MTKKCADEVVARLRSFYEQHYCEAFSKAASEQVPLLYSTFVWKTTMKRCLLRLLLLHARWNSLQAKTILDLGCGDGWLLRFCLEWGTKPDNLIGIDFNQTVLEHARQMSPEKMRFLSDSAEALSLANDSVDLILNIGVINHILSDTLLQQIFLECLRVVKPGGFMLVGFANQLYSYKGSVAEPFSRVFDGRSQAFLQHLSGWKVVATDRSVTMALDSQLDIIATLATEETLKTDLLNRKSTDDFLLMKSYDLYLAYLSSMAQHSSYSVCLLCKSPASGNI